MVPERRLFLIMQLFCLFSVGLFNDFEFFKKKNVVFDSFGGFEDGSSYIFPVFKRRMPVGTKAVFYMVAELQFLELMEERVKLRLRWKCDTVDIYNTVNDSGKFIGRVLVE